MFTKWFFSSFILALTFLGLSLERTKKYNQEIVLKYAANKVTLTEAEAAVVNIQNQLKLIGVETTKVVVSSNGNISISYHSTVSLEKIQHLFSRKTNFVTNYASLNLTQYPKKNQKDISKIFHIDVFEIETADTIIPDLNGHSTPIESKSNRDYTPVFFSYKNDVLVAKTPVNFLLANSEFLTTKQKLNSRYTKIHQVRAGPNSLFF